VKAARTGRRWAAPCAVAIATGAMLAIPATGVAGVPAVQDDRMTIASPIEEVPDRVRAVVETRAKVARFDILWSEVAPTRPRKPADPRDPAYNWERADLVINGFHRAKIAPIISVYSTPAWAVQGRNLPVDTQYNPNAPRARDFALFMRAVATRYRGKARHFEMWNEANLKGFFSLNGRSSLPHYKRLVKAAYPQIKAANRRAIVIAGVAGPNNSGRNGNVGARNWMLSLVGDRTVRFDAYSQHIYPSQAPRYSSRSYARAFPTWMSLPYIYSQLDRKKKGMKLYVTEAGYTTAQTPFRDSSTAVVTPARQRLYLNQIYNLPAVKSPRMAAVVWFNLEDNINWPAGLLFEGGRKKPAWAAFRAQASKPIPPALRAELNPRLR
jgi:hypothetical protein